MARVRVKRMVERRRMVELRLWRVVAMVSKLRGDMEVLKSQERVRI